MVLTVLTVLAVLPTQAVLPALHSVRQAFNERTVLNALTAWTTNGINDIEGINRGKRTNLIIVEYVESRTVVGRQRRQSAFSYHIRKVVGVQHFPV